MKVEKVTATIRYSKDIGGAWKSIELGAEGSVEPRETWQQAQAYLYQQLGIQMKALWAQNGNAHGETLQGRIDAPPSEIQSSPDVSQPVREHWCSEHNQEFKARTGQYGEFWSHQIKGTRQWCNESKK